MRIFIYAIVLAALAGGPSAADDLVIPEGGYVVSSDLSQLPEPVRAKREQLLAVAGTGDISELTPILDGDQTTVSFGGPDDRTAFLVGESADKEGIEALAILADILLAPYAALDGGDGEPVYVWPYLAAFDGLSDLSPDQRVEAYRIMGYTAFEEMMGLDA